MINLDISAKEAETSGQGMQPLPEGEYNVVCIKVEDKATKKGDGNYLLCHFQVVDHETCSGRKLSQMFMYAHPNTTTVNIGQANIKAWILQAGLAKDGDKFQLNPPELVGTNVKVSVVVKKEPASQDPTTGQTYPERMKNELSILPPSKAGVQTEKKSVDNSGKW